MSINKLARALHRGEKGFTLIELLIVVAILGILAAVIIPNVSGFMVTGRLNAANTEEENVKTAVLAYYADNATYPANSSQLLTGNNPLLAGAPKAQYYVDPSYGWIISVGATTGWNLAFTPGTTGAAGSHGKWVRP
jgi:prepilin-type N-terminal cleavage/methylation domain-containing protein